MLAVALPQGGDQFGVLLAPPGEEPLLELVEDQQHLLARAERSAPAAARPAPRPGPIPGQVRSTPSAGP